MVERRELSQSAAKTVLDELVRSGGTARSVVEEKGLAPIADTGELEALVERAIAADPKAVEQVRAGKQQAVGALVGAVMRETKGRADGAEVQRLVREKLGL
jgi:aspartyl-tRNA(Asn)/glutamyl-tRNA(Gln) amidotransferase subunit B